MPKTILIGIIALALIVAPGILSAGEAVTTQAEDQTSQTVGAFQVRGSFDVGLRVRDTQGNEDKYFEHLNLRTGPRVFNVDFEVNPVGSGFFDVLRVEAHNFGGDPFQSLGLTLKSYGDYSFRYHRYQSAYFYRDTTLAPEDASIRASNAGDFTTFDIDRVRDVINLDVNVFSRAKVFLNFNRQARSGEGTMTFDLNRDEFETDRPIDERKDDYTVGFQYSGEKVSVYVDETYRDYDNSFRTFLPGASPGENPDNSTEAFFFEQLTPYDFKMPQTTARVHLRPTPRIKLTAGLVYADLEQDFSYEETFRGINYSGNLVDDTLTGGGSIDRTTKLFDLNLTADVTDRIALIAAARFRRIDQDGQFRDAETVVPTTWELSSDAYDLGVQAFATPQLTLTAGLRFEQRDVLHNLEEQPNTERTTVFGNVVFAPSKKLNAMAEYERGDYDNPYTTMAPTDLDRFKVRVRARPVDGLSLVGLFEKRALDNTLAGVGGSEVDATLFTLSASYAVEDLTLWGRYTSRNLDNSIVQSLNDASFVFPAIYTADLDLASGGVRYTFSKRFAAGGEVTSYDTKGSFGLKWRQAMVFAEATTDQGYRFRAAYQYNDYDETDFGFDDYENDLFTVSVGRSF